MKVGDPITYDCSCKNLIKGSITLIQNNLIRVLTSTGQTRWFRVDDPKLKVYS